MGKEKKSEEKLYRIAWRVIGELKPGQKASGHGQTWMKEKKALKIVKSLNKGNKDAEYFIEPKKDALRALMQCVRFAIENLRPRINNNGMLLDMVTMKSEHWKETFANALELVDGVKVDREMMHVIDLPEKKRRAAIKAIMAKREKRTKFVLDSANVGKPAPCDDKSEKHKPKKKKK